MVPPDTKKGAGYIERVVSSHSDTLLRIAMHQLQNRSDAEDAVQTVFLKLLHTAPSFDGEEHEKAWLIRVTINHCRDLLRSSHRKKSVPLEEWSSAGQAAAANENGGEVLAAVRSLDEKYSTVVFLYYYEGYSTAEIARILASRQGTVESRLHRARARLKELLKGEWD